MGFGVVNGTLISLQPQFQPNLTNGPKAIEHRSRTAIAIAIDAVISPQPDCRHAFITVPPHFSSFAENPDTAPLGRSRQATIVHVPYYDGAKTQHVIGLSASCFQDE
jgi:7-cyano-7-deazaguanine synthase in queuosine biosynthesis